MTIQELIAQIRAGMAARLAERDTHRGVISEVRAACAGDNDRAPSEDEAARVEAARSAIATIDADVEAQQARVAELEAELERDEAAARLAREVNPTGTQRRGYDQQTRVTSEPRTYSREEDRRGVQFLQDVSRQFLFNAPDANERLSRHMQEERVERGGQLDRATGTANFSGLVVPQYLTDEFAPLARAGRPFADACRHHDLPESGMTVHIGKVTTGSKVDDQATENSNVSEQDMDDSLIDVAVRTAAGQQTISRQGVERGTGIESTTIEDLFRAYAVNLDGKVLNDATIGATKVATPITYTSAAPSASELYPKTLQAPAAVEAALLDQAVGDVISVMHSRRWYWLQSQLSATWPTFGQPQVPAQLAGVNFGERYGAGFRGVLPNGTPVIVDNNLATNLGAGTNEDELLFGAQSEFHLWEDPNAPMLIRAEQAKAASLGILLVVYGYYAFLADRQDHAQVITGTGLVTPTWA